MAVTKIHAIKGTLKKALDYIMNEEKTQDKLLVSGFSVAPETAYLEFQMTANLAEAVNGDRSRIGGSNILAYHMIQSFWKKDQLTPEEAHELGRRWADEVTGGQHEYVLATHVDKGHIHNHVIFNAFSQKDYQKFRTEPFKTAQKLRDSSDRLCEEKGLHVVENPQGRGKSRTELWESAQGASWKAQIQKTIDRVLPTVADYGEFVEALKSAGVRVSGDKHIAYQMEGQGQRTRGNKIGSGYTREGILARIHAGKSNLVHFATLTSKLVREGESRFFTRIPYTQEYVHFDKERTSWVEPKKTLGVFVSEEQTYTVCDAQGRALRAVSGAELMQHYTDKTRPSEAERVKEGAPARIRGSLQPDSRFVLPLSARLKLLTTKQRVANIQELADALRVMRQEGVVRYADFEVRRLALQEEQGTLKKTILQPAEQGIQALQKIAECMATYQKYRPIMEKIEAAPFFNKKKLQRRYDMELRILEHAMEGLNPAGLHPEKEAERILEAFQKAETNAERGREKISALDGRILTLERTKQLVDSVTRSEQRQNTRRTERTGERRGI